MQVRTARKRIIVSIVSAAVVAGVLLGCHGQVRDEPKTPQSPDFSNASHIAELATLECYSHNVVKLYDPPGMPWEGERKLWMEYSGTVRIGIDAAKVEILGPDENNVVVVRVPEAKIIGEPGVDDSSFVDVATTESFFIPDLSAEEKQEAFAKAQADMVDSIANDDTLLAAARSRAKQLLEEYIVNAGEEIGETYTVRFEDIETADAETSE